MAEQVLEALLGDQAARAARHVGLACRINKHRFVPPAKDRFGEFWYRIGTPQYQRLSYCGSAEVACGILQFTVYTPERLGVGYSKSLAENLKETFERSIIARDGHFVLLGKLKAFTANGTYKGYSIDIVDAGFRYFRPQD